MTDVHNSAQRSYNMSRIQGRDTKPEMRARKLLHSMGFRYRLHVKDLPGKPDLVFPAAKTVLFVHGCFWHMHGCKYGKPVPATNQTFWAEKRRSNVDRDQRNRRELREAGWSVFEIWECHTREEETMRKKLAPLVEFLRARQARASTSS
ncbi:MAG TPA: very short patch repair endonuclease [Bryobacteraceae bacterium]|nr:very short patch repair endonuclease [Bryobacteraceae bacterium]